MIENAPAAEFPLEKINAAHKQTLLIYAGIASSLPVYVLMVELLRHSQPAAQPMAALSLLRIAFFILAGMFVFTSTVIKGMLLRAAPADPVARLGRLRVASIVTAAFAEGPAVLGFALFIIARQRTDFYLLLVVAAYMLVRHLPQQAAWQLYVRRGGDAR
jgi:hypothetical protein